MDKIKQAPRPVYRIGDRVRLIDPRPILRIGYDVTPESLYPEVVHGRTRLRRQPEPNS